MPCKKEEDEINSLVQNSFGHGLLGVEGINDGEVRSVPSSSSTFYKNEKDK